MLRVPSEVDRRIPHRIGRGKERRTIVEDHGQSMFSRVSRCIVKPLIAEHHWPLGNAARVNVSEAAQPLRLCREAVFDHLPNICWGWRIEAANEQQATETGVIDGL